MKEEDGSKDMAKHIEQSMLHDGNILVKSKSDVRVTSRTRTWSLSKMVSVA